MVHGLRIAAPLRLDRRADSSLMHHPFDAKPAELGGTTDVRHFRWGLAGAWLGICLLALVVSLCGCCWSEWEVR